MYVGNKVPLGISLPSTELKSQTRRSRPKLIVLACNLTCLDVDKDIPFHSVLRYDLYGVDILSAPSLDLYGIGLPRYFLKCDCRCLQSVDFCNRRLDLLCEIPMEISKDGNIRSGNCVGRDQHPVRGITDEADAWAPHLVANVARIDETIFACF